MRDDYYRKKPVVIQAFQMTADMRDDANKWPDWAIKAYKNISDGDRQIYFDMETRNGMDDLKVMIHTLEGDMEVSLNDWVIRGVKGELYPCKPDVFTQTYEKEQ